MALSDTDRQVLQWLREGRQDAEIAVRLGVNVGEARARIERIRKELGARDRAELAASKAGAESGRHPGDDWRRPETAIAGTARLTSSDGEGFSLRAVIVAAFTGVALAGLGTLAVLSLLGDDGGTPAVGPATITPTATPTNRFATTPTPIPPTPTPHPGLAAITEAPADQWVRTEYESGGTLPDGHGIYFMDTATGDAVGYTLTGAAEGQWFSYTSAYDNRLVFGQSQVLDRTTGRVWEWDPAALSVWAASQNAMLVQETEYTFGSNQSAGTPRFHFIYSDGFEVQELASLELPDEPILQPSFFGYRALLEPRGPHVLIMAVDELTGRVRLYLGDVANGEIRRILAAAAPPGSTSRVDPPQLTANGDGFIVTQFFGQQGAPGTNARVAYLFDWAGDLQGRVEQTSVTGQETLYFSPNGNYAIAESNLPLSNPSVEPLNERWPAITLYEHLGPGPHDWSPLWRVKGATMVFGDRLEGSRWLADSSGFVANIAATPAGSAFWEHQGAVFSLDGSYELLPRYEPSDELFSLASPAFLPSPDDTDLFSNHRSGVYNRATGEWFAFESPASHAHLTPWNGTSREIVFAVPDGGHGGNPSPVLLQPLIEYPPFADSFLLVVSGGGECVNMRTKPGTTGDIITCLPDGSIVTPIRPADVPRSFDGDWPADEPFDGEGVHYNADDEVSFAYVSAQEGPVGWVAIQYLDWAV
jgi:DNA-binding CsgD family transcriptional regulator